jgi:hypothetical protein
VLGRSGLCGPGRGSAEHRCGEHACGGDGDRCCGADASLQGGSSRSGEQHARAVRRRGAN